MTEEQIKETNWIDTELENTATPDNFEKLPTLKLEPNKIFEIEVDFSNPPEKWTDADTKTTKAIIPVTHLGIKKNFWLNVRNPLYHQMLERAKQGITKFKVLQTGVQKDTKYNLVD